MNIEMVIELIEKRRGRCQRKIQRCNVEIQAEVKSLLCDTSTLISLTQERREQELLSAELGEVLDIIKAYASLHEVE